MTHGTRACYQQTACRCTPCRAAEAAYRASLRRQHAHGHIPLGTVLSGKAAMARILEIKRRLRDQLRPEGVTECDVAHAMGLRTPRLQLQRGHDGRHTDRITVRKYAAFMRAYRRWMDIDLNPPEESNASRR